MGQKSQLHPNPSNSFISAISSLSTRASKGIAGGGAFTGGHGGRTSLGGAFTLDRCGGDRSRPGSTGGGAGGGGFTGGTSMPTTRFSECVKSVVYDGMEMVLETTNIGWLPF